MLASFSVFAMLHCHHKLSNLIWCASVNVLFMTYKSMVQEEDVLLMQEFVSNIYDCYKQD